MDGARKRLDSMGNHVTTAESEHITVPDASEVSFYKVKGKWSGLASWIFSTDHKRIGLMYLFLMMTKKPPMA